MMKMLLRKICTFATELAPWNFQASRLKLLQADRVAESEACGTLGES
jgi:hypothetical protein